LEWTSAACVNSVGATLLAVLGVDLSCLR
jgi:hypothetical protein